VLELVAINYSPWSEKARWALDYYGVPYEETPYLAMLGELALRRRLGRWSGKVTIPMLFDGDTVIEDSYKISEYAEEKHGAQRPLFPEAFRNEIKSWNERSEAGLAAGRALTTERVVNSPEARREAMPPVPKILMGPLVAPVTRLGISFLRRKYKFGDTLDVERLALKKMLESLREALSDGRQYLLGDAFSYADLCMAVSLQFVRPVTDEYIKLGPATRKAWTDDAMSSEFGDLLGWRDRVYESHRRS
jgi:glutathione S-transferase